MTEYIILIALVSILLIIGIAAFGQEKGTIVVLTGLLATAFGWSVKNGIEYMKHRATLVILESLSDKKGKTREELRSIVYANSSIYMILRSTPDTALATLVKGDKVQIENGIYRMSNQRMERTV